MPKQLATFEGWAENRSPRPQVQLTPQGDVDKIEVYGDAIIAWRGTEYTLPLRADRYRHSSGMSDWRFTVAHRPYDANLSDVAMRAIYNVIGGPLRAYIASDDYAPDFRAATYRAIASNLRGERYSTDGTRRLISVCDARGDLTGDHRLILKTAADHLDAFLALVRTT